MRRTRDTSQSRRAKPVNSTAMAIIFLCCALVFAFALGIVITGNPERQAMLLQEQQAVLPFRILSKQSGYVVWIIARIGLAVIVGYIIYYSIAILRNWLDLRSRQVQAQNGIFPLLRISENQYYDANRSMGESPIITALALEVQRTSAIRSDKISIKMASPQLPQLTKQLEQSDINLPQMVNLREVCPQPTLNSLVLGIGQNGLVKASLYELMHVLCVGASGFGKSAFLRALIWQFAQVREDVQIAALDINGSEFNSLKGWSKLMFPVARNTNDAIGVLQGVSAEIDRRKVLYEQYPTAYDLKSYNQLAQEKLAPIVLLADEATNLLNQKGVGEPLREVVQTARQYGCYLLLAGQSAKHSILDTQIRDNFSSKFCFHTSPSSYRTVLGQSVTDVSVKGRAWSQLTGQTLQQVQIPFVSREAVFNVLEQGAPTQTMPIIDVELAADTKASMIFDLLSNGDLSDSKIAREVFGYSNGRTVEQVAQARRNITTTTTHTAF